MIKSKVITYKNLYDKKIVGISDYISPFNRRKPLIIIPPAFGETKTDSLSLSYFLVMNGFNVFRYDVTNHPGESDGDIFNFTLDNGKDDLLATVDLGKRELGSETIGVVAKSLAWRYSLKTAIQDNRIKFILGIGGIVNLQGTLKAVYNEDILGAVLKKKYSGWKLTDIFGFEVSRKFIENAISGNYHNVNSTRDDLKKNKIPLVFFQAEKDAWVEMKDIRKIIKGNESLFDLNVIKKALHQIEENPLAALFVFRQAVVKCKKYMSKEDIEQDDVLKPQVRIVASRNRLEKNRLKPYELTKDIEKNFWRTYLPKYSFVNNMQDFKEYLDAIVNLIGDIKENEIVLDAGCGPGYLGAALLGRYSNCNFKYLAADIVENVLTQAKTEHEKLSLKLSRKKLIKKNRQALYYTCCDMDRSWHLSENNLNLCFKDNAFDKICSSLLISYLKDPLFFLKECYRMLKPGGEIIVSTLKPYADLSQIYRNFTDHTKNTKDLEKARKLLSSAGMIKQKESQGYYEFYSEKDLTNLLVKAGFKDVECYRTFGNQVNLAIAIKK